ncbi:MAG TPA: hypothetical protein VNU74_05800 [Terriglobales bacterium]|jgi:hypothetical protein|nr:hypothetical protein [Terriglobales bacterium]
MPNSFCATVAFAFLLVLPGCSQQRVHQSLRQSDPPTQALPQILAVNEPWFGHPRHISVGYSSQDPAVIRKQIDRAKAQGISGFVVDWYGDREPFIDRAYAQIQAIAAEKHFHVSMMYDETDEENGATDEALADFSYFRDTYLSPNAPGHQAYLTYNDRPVIFIFPKGSHTDWNRVRAAINKWNPPPLLIYEDDPGASSFPAAFDGLYAWVNPGKHGWTADGSNWGEDYLEGFYSKMQSKYPDKIAVGGAWAGFDDKKASWGLNRHISQRCGQTFADTMNLWRQYYSVDRPLPFLLIATWNDYEEGTAIERGLAKCGPGSQSPAGQ